MVTQKMICARAAARRQRPLAQAPGRAGSAPQKQARARAFGGARLHLHHARPGPLAGGQLP